MTLAKPTSTVGGPPASPVQLKLVEVLEDREWHDVEKVIREVGKIIPPGQAVRRAEVRRKGATKPNREVPAERKRPLSEDRLIASGRRSYARDAFHGTRKYLEFKREDGVEWVRLLEIPGRVARDRARARARFHFEPTELADEIRDGADAGAMMGELSPAQLLVLALELARRERARSSQPVS